MAIGSVFLALFLVAESAIAIRVIQQLSPHSNYETSQMDDEYLGDDLAETKAKEPGLSMNAKDSDTAILLNTGSKTKTDTTVRVKIASEAYQLGVPSKMSKQDEQEAQARHDYVMAAEDPTAALLYLKTKMPLVAVKTGSKVDRTKLAGEAYQLGLKSDKTPMDVQMAQARYDRVIAAEDPAAELLSLKARPGLMLSTSDKAKIADEAYQLGLNNVKSTAKDIQEAQARYDHVMASENPAAELLAFKGKFAATAVAGDSLLERTKLAGEAFQLGLSEVSRTAKDEQDAQARYNQVMAAADPAVELAAIRAQMAPVIALVAAQKAAVMKMAAEAYQLGVFTGGKQSMGDAIAAQQRYDRVIAAADPAAELADIKAKLSAKTTAKIQAVTEASKESTRMSLHGGRAVSTTSAKKSILPTPTTL